MVMQLHLALSGARPTTLPTSRSSIRGSPLLGAAPRLGLGAAPRGLGRRDPLRSATSVRVFAVAKASSDSYKEEGRKYLRSVFDPDRWEVHRSTSRYARHILGLPTSRLVRGMAEPLLYVVGVATLVALYESAFQSGALPAELPDLQLKSKELFGLTSFALSLLLVFRTNASYERWDGARKMWGLVLNRSRDITRQGLSWLPADRPELRDMLCRWVPAFSKTLMCHLRKGDDLVTELQACGLLPHEIAAVQKATHKPNYVMQVLAQIIREGNVGTAPTVAMENNITSFEDCLGGCERILRTPIPLFYTRHTSRFLMIWLTLLPFALVGSCGWSTVPLSATIAFLLLGIEEIGVSIEEPFSILALEAISNTALTNVKELQALHDTNRQADPETDISAHMIIQLALPAEKRGPVPDVDAGSSSGGSSGGSSSGLNGEAKGELNGASSRYLEAVYGKQ